MNAKEAKEQSATRLFIKNEEVQHMISIVNQAIDKGLFSCTFQCPFKDKDACVSYLEAEGYEVHWEKYVEQSDYQVEIFIKW